MAPKRVREKEMWLRISLVQSVSQLGVKKAHAQEFASALRASVTSGAGTQTLVHDVARIIYMAETVGVENFMCGDGDEIMPT